jgi:hypothetical protein
VRDKELEIGQYHDRMTTSLHLATTGRYIGMLSNSLLSNLEIGATCLTCSVTSAETVISCREISDCVMLEYDAEYAEDEPF